MLPLLYLILNSLMSLRCMSRLWSVGDSRPACCAAPAVCGTVWAADGGYPEPLQCHGQTDPGPAVSERHPVGGNSVLRNFTQPRTQSLPFYLQQDNVV